MGRGGRRVLRGSIAGLKGITAGLGGVCRGGRIRSGSFLRAFQRVYE